MSNALPEYESQNVLKLPKRCPCFTWAFIYVMNICAETLHYTISCRLVGKHLLTSMTMSCMGSFTRSQRIVLAVKLLKCMTSLNFRLLNLYTFFI